MFFDNKFLISASLLATLALLILLFFFLGLCHEIAKVGDGICHDDLNIENCNYDSGDCCSNINQNINKYSFCEECLCKQNENT